MGGVITVINKMEMSLIAQLSCGIALVLKAIMLYQINLLLLEYATKIYHRKRLLLHNIIGFSTLGLKEKVKKKRRCRRFWVRPKRTSLWWDNLREDVAVDEE